MENNFSINEEVICVETHEDGCVIKGKKYTVIAIFINCCNIVCVNVKEVFNPNYPYAKTEICNRCSGEKSTQKHWSLRATRFAKIKSESKKE